MNNDTIGYSPRSIEDKPLDRVILVHGAMHYQCKECGRVFKMWLEKGLEDKTPDSGDHKPVPFTIGCLCGGLMEHIAWHQDIELPHYMPLGEHMDYFENLEGSSCGVSHLRTDGNASILGRTKPMPQILFPTPEEERPREIPENSQRKSGLEAYSTTQLKEELRRRKRW